MVDNDIYDSRGKYERFKENLESYLDVPRGCRVYRITNRENLKYFYKLMSRFEAADISYIRRLRLLRSFLIVCHAIEPDLATVSREDIDRMVAFANGRNKGDKTKKEFVTDLKHMWRIILPDNDERSRPDESVVPYVVRHLSTRIDKSRERIRKDRFSLPEFERLVASFGTDSRMQALLHLCLESLGRPQEVLGRNVGDVELHENYAKVFISEHGKEGVGFLRCIDSFYYLSKWLNEHPRKEDRNAPLFVNLGTRQRFARLKPPAVSNMLRDRCRLLGIGKPITLYSLKRNGVTICRLRGDSDVDIQHRARWATTKQLRTYDLSSQDDTFKIELMKRGMIKPEQRYASPDMMKRCPFCSHENGMAESVCLRCRRPLDREKLEQAEKRREDKERALQSELGTIRDELARARQRDELLLQVMRGLKRKGRLHAVVDTIGEEGLTGELLMQEGEPSGKQKKKERQGMPALPR